MSERRRLPDRRRAVTWRLKIGGQTLYLSVGLFPDGGPGEVFLTLSKAGSTLRSMADGWARMASYALQHGTPLEAIVRANRHSRFEPAGPVEGHERITHSTSLLDLAVRVLGLEFLPGRDDLADVGPAPAPAGPKRVPFVDMGSEGRIERADDAPASEGQAALGRRVEALAGTTGGGEICRDCGSADMQRTGTCLTCRACGSSAGGCG